jgi:hypothetical protein
MGIKPLKCVRCMTNYAEGSVFSFWLQMNISGAATAFDIPRPLRAYSGVPSGAFAGSRSSGLLDFDVLSMDLFPFHSASRSKLPPKKRDAA